LLGERLLPDEKTLEKISRYEAHLSRLMFEALHEPDAIQIRRSGGAAPGACFPRGRTLLLRFAARCQHPELESTGEIGSRTLHVGSQAFPVDPYRPTYPGRFDITSRDQLPESHPGKPYHPAGFRVGQPFTLGTHLRHYRLLIALQRPSRRITPYGRANLMASVTLVVLPELSGDL
jgi:hypothetical protein